MKNPEFGSWVAGAAKYWDIIVRDDSMVAFKSCFAAMVTLLANGEEVSGGKG